MSIRSLAYLRIEATDMAAWREYGLKVLGMIGARAPIPTTCTCAWTTTPARLVIVPGERDGLYATAGNARTPKGCRRSVSALPRPTGSSRRATKEEAAERNVVEFVKCRDASGSRLGDLPHDRPAAPPHRESVRAQVRHRRAGARARRARNQGRAADLEFYRDVLGFKLRDSMRLPPQVVGVRRTVTRRGCASWAATHATSLAFAPLPNPSGIVHLMVEVENSDDVGLCLDRALRKNVKMSATLGRHVNDLMLSFYMKTPGGFDVEFGCEGLEVEDDT
ncbi:2,3-dihydroxybiphenyl 1,2-dioxygenase [Rhodococcus hoagii]|nr:2,3-dihydroxybiphenyl 1,2-dioxygenase [Prescottella equi]